MITGYVLVQTQVGRALDAANEIARIPGVLAAEGVTGPYDVIVKVEGKSLDDLGRQVVMRIQEVEGITRTLTCPVVHL